MARREGLKAAYATVTTAGVNIGSEVPTDFRRYVYSIKTANLYAGANSLQVRRNATTIDRIKHATRYEMWKEPEDPKEDSLPMYVLTAGEQLSGITDNGDCWVRVLYVDAP